MLKGGKASFVSSHSLFRCFQFLLLCLPHLHLTCREIKHGISHLTRSCMHAHIEQEASITWLHGVIGILLLVAISMGTGRARSLSSRLEYLTFPDTTHSIRSSNCVCVVCVCVCVCVCVYVCVKGGGGQQGLHYHTPGI